MNWALTQTTGSSQAKAVLLILANRSDQNGRCWPGIDGIAEQTEISRRTVIRKIKDLADSKLLCVSTRGGDGAGRKSNVYQLHIGGAKCQSCTLGQCDTGAGQCDTGAGQCVTLTPEPSDKPKKNRQSLGRATVLPDDFELTDERRAVAVAEQVPADRTFQKFCDYWRAASGQRARKRDWDATWRNWCRTEADRSRGRRSADDESDPYFRQLREGMAHADN